MSLAKVTDWCRAQTKQEIVLAGLLGGVCPFNLEIRDFAGKGRGVVVLDSVPKGAYVLKYEYSAVYGRRE